MALDVAQIEGLISPTGDLSPHPHAVKALWQGISRDVSVRENAGTASWRKHGKCQRGGMLPSMRLSGPDQAMSALFHAFSFYLDEMAFNGDQLRLHRLAEACKFNTNTIIIATLQVNCLNFDSSSTAALGCTLSFIGC